VTGTSTRQRSGAAFLDNEALEAASEDRDECNRNEGDEVLLRTLEDRVQPPVAAQPSERAFNGLIANDKTLLAKSAVRLLMRRWLRVSDTAEMPQIDQRVGHQFHTVVPLLFELKAQQQPLELVLPREGPLHA